MSEWHPQVVRLGKIGKHPDADKLEITHVLGSYQVVMQAGLWSEGDLAAFIPIDTLIPVENVPFLESKAKNGLVRIDAVRLRGMVSNGMILPLPTEDPTFGWEDGIERTAQEGDSVVEIMGLQKYERPLPLDMTGSSLDNDPFPGIVKYDLEGIRKFAGVIEEGEMVAITEKIHGSNARFVFRDGQFHIGSRTRWMEPDKAGVWGQVALQYDLETVLGGNSRTHGLVFYGEVYGGKVQDLKYGKTAPDLVFFDILDTDTGAFLPHWEFRLICTKLNLPTVPLLLVGKFDMEHAINLAEGDTVLGDRAHMREGIVVRPLKERWHPLVGRVCLKLAGEDYLTRRQAA